jgi:hypothetical protein
MAKFALTRAKAEREDAQALNNRASAASFVLFSVGTALALSRNCGTSPPECGLWSTRVFVYPLACILYIASLRRRARGRNRARGEADQWTSTWTLPS